MPTQGLRGEGGGECILWRRALRRRNVPSLFPLCNDFIQIYTKPTNITSLLRARFERSGRRRDVGFELEKITPVKTLGEQRSSLASSRGYFPLDASRSRLSLDFCALSSSSSLGQASEYARARTVMRKDERERETAGTAERRRVREKGRGDIPVSSKRFEPLVSATYRRGL